MKMSRTHSALQITVLAAKFIAAPALMSAMLAVGGCYAPQPTMADLYGSDKILTDQEYLEMARCWLDSERSNYKVWSSLSENKRETLNQLWTKGHQEILDRGQMSSDTLTNLKSVCDGIRDEVRYEPVSFDAIASNPTPDLNGQFESWDRRRQNDSMVYNQNFRALADEWSRFWLMEMPGGTPYDTVNTTGRF